MAVGRQDGGYAWVILVTCAAIMFIGGFICLGVFGVLFVELIAYFPEEPKSKIGLVLALQFGAVGVLGCVLSPVIKRVGSRRLVIGGAGLATLGFLISSFVRRVDILIVSHGIITGFGGASTQIGAMVSVQTYFDKRRAFALGAIFFIGGVGVLTGAPLAVLLVNTYALPGTFLIFGGLAAQCIWLGALLRPLNAQEYAGNREIHGQLITEGEIGETTIPAKQTQEADIEMVAQEKKNTGCSKNGPEMDIYYVLYIVAIYFEHLGHFVPLSLLPLKATLLGQSETTSALLVTYIASLTNVVVLAVGLLGDRIPGYRRYLCVFAIIITGALTAASSAFTAYYMLVVYGVLFGTFSGIYVVFHGVVPIDVWGVGISEQFTTHWFAAIGFAMITVNPLNGLILDRTKNPSLPFLVFGLAQVVGGLLMAVSVWGGSRRRKSRNVREID